MQPTDANVEPQSAEPCTQPADPICGAAFPPFTKAIACLAMAAVVASGVRAADQAGWPTLTVPGWLFLVTVVGVAVYGWWVVLTSTVCIDATSIRQTWLWHKQVKLAELSQLKLVQVPGLSWLLVPRLVVRAGAGITTFHAGSPAVLAAFRRLAYGGDGT